MSIPVYIITGALGAGKTTAIAKLLSDKPEEEAWLVILNEFTDTGIDTLTLASAARGAYDVRMIPGGCLCCTGEEDFRRQLSNLLAKPVGERPARILIEPSGIAHPAAIVDELRDFERSGSLRLISVICLLEAPHANHLDALHDSIWEQIEAADVVLLSKAEQADVQMRDRFTAWAQELFPAKRCVGFAEHGAMPNEALDPPARQFSFDAFAVTSIDKHIADSPQWRLSERRVHLTPPSAVSLPVRSVTMGSSQGQARTYHWLDRDACGWVIPAEIMFDLARVQHALETSQLMYRVERLKAVLRVGIDRWCLLQRWGMQSSVAASAWHQDNRIEVQLQANSETDWKQWDRLWQSLVE